ncbi:hydroxymethylglutaryl-CoA lyase [Metabacillus arenae]|uniref:Hydroxymethylglutaryl-CoA lyase n=1 Tax=Metabacillus arenae TaxID=2771434 RepID=A0A926RVQ5_9BACI|nr:hydroxymethylglutaryl-CoA lyase [Metabacillus arenae]MBD1378725.1 hydroxymethylglutaryl-CoA lyase [Metabacillus arenae]
MHLPKNVTIIEVGPRDGLQNEAKFIETPVKIQFIEKLKEAGIKEMELTAFVSPKWVPQMKDADDIIASNSGTSRNIVLTPNEKGVERALEAGCKSIAFFVGVSDTFNLKNINKSTKESMEAILPMIKKLKDQDLFIRACISTAFYCPYEGKMKETDVLDLCGQFSKAGVDDLSVADTIGLANPLEAYSLFSKLKASFSETLLTAHFHDTRGMALANIFAALQAGIDRFDSSAGGLGGCPFAPGSSGNIATEDVVFMLEQMNISTGIDLSKLFEAIELVEISLSKPILSKQYSLLSKRLGQPRQA